MSLAVMLLNLATALAVVYALFLLILLGMQKSIIFPAPPKNLLLYEKYKGNSLTLHTDDQHIQGWKLSGTKPLSNVVIIYFGGNGEDVATTVPTLAKHPAATIYTFNYRSYGLSSGIPNEPALYNDALQIFNFVKTNHPKSKIAIIGYSLGSAVAGYLATKTDASYLILLSPLYSIERIAKESLNSFIPSFIVTNKFRLHEHVKNVTAETLVICAKNDKTIPLNHSKETYSNISAKKSFFIVGDVDHNSIYSSNTTFDLIESFIS